MTTYPLEEIQLKARQLYDHGYDVYQKWVCSGCGWRMVRAIPHYFKPMGRCDRCKHETDIARAGCDYVVTRNVPPSQHQPEDKAGRSSSAAS